VEINSLVERITREVMDKMKAGKAVEEKAPLMLSSGFKAETSTRTALLVSGSPRVCAGVLSEAASFLKTCNFQVTAVIPADTANVAIDGVTVIRCNNFKDCASAVRSSSLVAILLADVGTFSHIANLFTDRFDVGAAVEALQAGIEVWGLKILGKLPPAIEGKIDYFSREIENFGIKITSVISSVKQASIRASVVSPSSSDCFACPASGGEECAGCGLCANLNPGEVKNVVEQGAERISASYGISPVPSEIAAMIDHTALKPDTTREQIIKLCEEARQYGFASCCVNPVWVSTVAECLKGSPVKTCVVIGFPLGANSTVVKSMETRDAIAAGADEVDMVINVGALKAGDYELVRRDIEAVVEAAQGRIVKVILETALLTDEEKVKACQLAKQAGADFVKTSTGFGPGGATAKDVALMRKTVGKYMGVKASGGIRDYETASEMIKAGATRIGASASVAIVKGTSAKPGGGY